MDNTFECRGEIYTVYKTKYAVDDTTAIIVVNEYGEDTVVSVNLSDYGLKLSENQIAIDRYIMEDKKFCSAFLRAFCVIPEDYKFRAINYGYNGSCTSIIVDLKNFEEIPTAN